MLWQSEKLYKAWLLKEASFKFREAKTQEEAERELHNWLIWAESTEMEEFKACSELIEDDIYEAISMETCVEGRNIIGGPAKVRTKAEIEAGVKYLQEVM